MDFISGGENYSLGNVDCAESIPVRHAKPKGHDIKGVGSHSVNVKWKRKFSIKHNAYYWHDGKTSVWKVPVVDKGDNTEVLKQEVSPTSGEGTLSKTKEEAQGRMVFHRGSTGKCPCDKTANKEETFTTRATNQQHIVEKAKGLKVRDFNVKERDVSWGTNYLNASSSSIKVHFFAVCSVFETNPILVCMYINTIDTSTKHHLTSHPNFELSSWLLP